MKYLTVLLCTIVTALGVAQSPNNFPIENSSWTNLNFTYWWSGPMQGPPDSYSLQAEPRFSMTDLDTLIGGNLYSQIFLNDTIYQGASRNEGDQVYFILHDETTESLLYDFGVVVGDSIFNVFTGNMGLDDIEWDYYELLNYHVTQIDTVVYEDGIERKRLFLDYGDVRWVEGIGNMQGLFWYGGLNVSNYEDHLVRFCADDQIVLLQETPPYSLLDENSCYSGFTTGISDYENSQFAIYPNPVSDYLYINQLDAEPIIGLRIIDSSGKMISELIDPKLADKPIDLQGVATGMYFLQVITEKSTSLITIIRE